KPWRSPATKKGRCRLHGGASGSGPFWQAEWPVPSRRADQGRDCGAAEIQRTAENAPRWPDVNTQNRVRALASPLSWGRGSNIGDRRAILGCAGARTTSMAHSKRRDGCAGDAVYFTFVTGLTIGYGAILPRQALARSPASSA